MPRLSQSFVNQRLWCMQRLRSVHVVRYRKSQTVRSALAQKNEFISVDAVGEVRIKNTQRKFQFDLDQIHSDLDVLRSILKVKMFEVDLLICGENQMRSLNHEHRGMDKSTDILSFPLHQFKTPEKLTKRKYLDLPMLGDLIVCPLYIERQCKRDKQEHESGKMNMNDDVSADRGVSRAMSTLYSVQERMPLLLIHGMLHLLGHDHETDKDWQRMVKREEEVLAEYRQIKSSNTGRI